MQLRRKKAKFDPCTKIFCFVFFFVTLVTARDFFPQAAKRRNSGKNEKKKAKKRIFWAEEDSNFVLILSVECLLSSKLPSVDFFFPSALPSLFASDRFIRLGSEVQTGEGAGRKPVPRPLLRRPTRADGRTDGRSESPSADRAPRLLENKGGRTSISSV